jgi:competence protein ComGC
MSGNGNNGPSLQTGATQNLTLVVILAVSFIAIVIVIAWVALNNVREKIQSDAGDAIQTVLQTTQESLNLWAENKKFDLGQLAADPGPVG